MKITIDTNDILIVPQDIKWVKFKPPMTVVMWSDNVGTTVRCRDGDKFSYETGLLMCIAKRFFGNNGSFNDVLNEWVWSNGWDEIEETEIKEPSGSNIAHQECIEYNEKTIFDNIEIKRDLKDVIRKFITDKDALELIKVALSTDHLPEMFFEALPMPSYLKCNFNMLPDDVKKRTTRPILKIIEDMERAIYEY